MGTESVSTQARPLVRKGEYAIRARTVAQASATRRRDSAWSRASAIVTVPGSSNAAATAKRMSVSSLSEARAPRNDPSRRRLSSRSRLSASFGARVGAAEWHRSGEIRHHGVRWQEMDPQRLVGAETSRRSRGRLCIARHDISVGCSFAGPGRCSRFWQAGHRIRRGRWRSSAARVEEEARENQP